MASKKKNPTVPVPSADLTKGYAKRVLAALGSLGGKARAKKLSADEISAISRKAGLAGGRGRGKNRARERFK